MTRLPVRAAGRMALVPSTAPPRQLPQDPAALDNREKVYTRTHIDALRAHAFRLVRRRFRITNRCGRVRYAARRSSRERLPAVENLLATKQAGVRSTRRPRSSREMKKRIAIWTGRAERAGSYPIHLLDSDEAPSLAE